MLRRVALAFLLLMVAASTLEIRPRQAFGQSSSFRLLSSFYALVGETVYHLDPGNPPIGWHALPYGSFDLPPVPASSLLSLESDIAITDSGEGWIRMGASGWQSVGVLPGVVSTQRSTWGAIKAKYR